MVWNLSVNAVPNTPGNILVAAIYAASAPNVLVQSQVVPGPYVGNAIPISFIGVDAIVYIFTLWENSGPSPSGIARNSFKLEPTSSETKVREDLQLIADVSPGLVSGVNYYQDTSLAGWDYEVERVAMGSMYDADQIAKDTVPGSEGWHLLQVGDLINPNERFVIHFYPQVSSVSLSGSGSSSGGGFISGADLITGDITLTAADMERGKLIQGATDHLRIILPTLSSVQDNKFLNFYSNGGNHTSAIIDTAGGGDQYQWITPTEIVLSQSEQLKIFKAFGKWWIDFASPDILKVGQLQFDFQNARPNQILANGALVSRLQYAALWNWLQQNPAMMVSEAAWGNTALINTITYSINKGKYSNGDGTTTFRLPQLYNYKYFAALAANPGSLIAGNVGQFSEFVKINIGDSFNGGGGVGWNGTPGRGQANPTLQQFAQTFNAGRENTPTSIGMFALITIG